MKLKMDGFKTFVFIASLLIFGNQMSYGSPVSVSCTSIYDEGGVAAVLRSTECSHWHLSDQSLAMNCQFATNNELDGQEDRMSCNLDMQIPFTGKNGTQYVKVGVVAIFDSIFSGEASDMASKLLLDYFLAHTMYFSSKVPSLYNDQEKVNLNEEGRSLRNFLNASSPVKPLTIEESEESTHKTILKNALLRTIHDIESTFLKEASEKKQFLVGTTATVAVLADGQILVANIGDSKAFLCSENINSHNVTGGTLIAKEMTQEHYLTREDERARFEAAGVLEGCRSWWSDPPCGILAMTRAIGHLGFKSDGAYHVTVEPEVTDWQPLTDADTYLILQTREVSRKLETPQNVCDLLPHRASTGGTLVQCHLEPSLAECIASSAAHKRLEPLESCPPGSLKQMCDDEDEHHQGKGVGLSVIVVPLISSGFLQHPSA